MFKIVPCVFQYVVKDCKNAMKRVNDMARELNNINQVSNSGALAKRLAEIEVETHQVDNIVQERVRFNFFLFQKLSRCQVTHWLIGTEACH